MQNFELLKEAGRTNKPILLKRGLSATIEEFTFAAEYIASQGNKILFYVNVVFVLMKKLLVIHLIFLPYLS